MRKESIGIEISELLRNITMQERRLLDTQLPVIEGLTEQQGRVLTLIAEHPGMIQRELVDLLRRRSASVSSLLKNLEKTDYIERKIPADNARNKEIYLTDKGQAVVDGFYKAYDLSTEQMFAPLNKEEQRKLAKLLRKINAGFAKR